MAERVDENAGIVSISVRNTQAVRRMFESVVRATTFVYAKDKLERLVLDRVRGRFEALKEHPNAQHDPDGTLWVALSEKRKSQKRNANRILHDEETNRGRGKSPYEHLRRSVQILRSHMGHAQLRTNTGGGFRIGVNPSHPAARYAGLHEKGTSRIPQRQFLGISDSDVDAIDRWIARQFEAQGINVNG